MTGLHPSGFVDKFYGFLYELFVSYQVSNFAAFPRVNCLQRFPQVLPLRAVN